MQVVTHGSVLCQRPCMRGLLVASSWQNDGTLRFDNCPDWTAIFLVFVDEHLGKVDIPSPKFSSDVLSSSNKDPYYNFYHLTVL